MITHADKMQENKSQSVANEFSQKQNGGESSFQIVGNRPAAIAQRKLQDMADNSPQVKQLSAIQKMANNRRKAKKAIQLQVMADNYSIQQLQAIQGKEDNTGLPGNLKMGIENLTGLAMDDVKAHYNSAKPTQLQAYAYALETGTHLGSGQEKHLPHEAWHAVRQKRGRVKPTMQMKGKFDVKDNTDVIGANALQAMGGNHDSRPDSIIPVQRQAGPQEEELLQVKSDPISAPLQRDLIVDTEDLALEMLYSNFDAQKGEKEARMQQSSPGEKGDTAVKGMDYANEAISVPNEATFRAMTRINPNGGRDRDEFKSADAYGDLGKAYNVTSLNAVLGMASALTRLHQASGKGGNWGKFVEASFDLGSGMYGTTSAISGMVSDYAEGASKGNAAAVSSASFAADNILQSLKGYVETGRKIVDAIKTAADKEVKPGHLERAEEAKDIIGSGASTAVSTIRSIKEIVALTGGSVGGFAEAVPILGLALAALDAAFRIYDLVKAGKSYKAMQDKKKVLEKTVFLERQFETSEFEIPEKMKTARDPPRLENQFETSAIGLPAKNKRSRWKRKPQKLKSRNENLPVEVDTRSPELQEYDFTSHLAEINRKRIVRAGIILALDLVKIGGEIATLTGVGAVAGVPMKGAAAGFQSAMGIFRTIKQGGRDYVSQNPDSRNIFGFNAEKSTKSKSALYARDIGYIFMRIANLQKYVSDRNTLGEEKHKVYDYIHAMGAVPTKLFRSFKEGGLDATIKYLLKSLKSRE